jgi:hypothetical protein
MNKKYDKPVIGSYLTQANYSPDKLSGAVINLAVALGYELKEEDKNFLKTMDWERLDTDQSLWLYGIEENAIDYLNAQESRSHLYWGHDGEVGAFGLWPDVEGAKEDCGFISSKKREFPEEDYEGEWLHINDHGNATLYLRENGENKEIWSIV